MRVGFTRTWQFTEWRGLNQARPLGDIVVRWMRVVIRTRASDKCMRDQRSYAKSMRVLRVFIEFVHVRFCIQGERVRLIILMKKTTHTNSNKGALFAKYYKFFLSFGLILYRKKPLNVLEILFLSLEKTKVLLKPFSFNLRCQGVRYVISPHPVTPRWYIYTCIYVFEF